MSERLALAIRRALIAQKIENSGQNTLCFSVSEQLMKIFLQLKDADSSSVLCRHEVVTRIASIALQNGTQLEKVADLLSRSNLSHLAVCPDTIALGLFESARSPRSGLNGRPAVYEFQPATPSENLRPHRKS